MGLLLLLGFMVPYLYVLGVVFVGTLWGPFTLLAGSGSFSACETLLRATTHRVLRIESEILYFGRGFFVRCSGKEPSLIRSLSEAEDALEASRPLEGVEDGDRPAAEYVTLLVVARSHSVLQSLLNFSPKDSSMCS